MEVMIAFTGGDTWLEGSVAIGSLIVTWCVPCGRIGQLTIALSTRCVHKRIVCGSSWNVILCKNRCFVF